MWQTAHGRGGTIADHSDHCSLQASPRAGSASESHRLTLTLAYPFTPGPMPPPRLLAHSSDRLGRADRHGPLAAHALVKAHVIVVVIVVKRALARQRPHRCVQSKRRDECSTRKARSGGGQVGLTVAEDPDELDEGHRRRLKSPEVSLMFCTREADSAKLVVAAVTADKPLTEECARVSLPKLDRAEEATQENQDSRQHQSKYCERNVAVNLPVKSDR